MQLRAAAALALLSPLALFAEPADACGGLFCSTTPVDQNSERILFHVAETGRITATVEIRYAGAPDAFSWIVPVAETPDFMDVAPASSLRLLDAATGPTIIPPPTTCSGGIPLAGNAPPPSPVAVPDADFTEGEPVQVEDLPVVGPFDPEVISSADPNALIEWLDENGYTVTEEMHPFIAEYVNTGFKFLGVKLTPDAGVSDIAPLMFSCPQGAPTVPLKLTAVASEPEMGVLVFVLGDRRYRPMNFTELVVPTDLVQFDVNRRTDNYYPLVSWLIDDAGGKAFIAEYAGDAASTRGMVESTFLPINDDVEARTWLFEQLDNTEYVSRLYTRISGWEMDDDPVFAPNDAGDISNVHDLSTRPPVEVCDGVADPQPCGQTYCGVGSFCATTDDGREGCVCRDGAVGRQITAPVSRTRAPAPAVFCQEDALDTLSSLEGSLDVCSGFACGEGGQCVAVNGFPTCRCDEGFAAVVDGSRASGVTCRPFVESFAPDALLWPDTASTCACAATPGRAAPFGAALALGLLALVRRRRAR